MKAAPVAISAAASKLDVGELGDAIDGEEHVDLALCGAQLAAVDMDVADPGRGEALTLGGAVSSLGSREMPCRSKQRCRALRVSLGMLSRKQPRTSSSGRRVRLPELDHGRLLSLGQDRAAWPARPHRRVRGVVPLPPLGHRLGVQPVAGGQGTGARLRRLELGSNSRRRAGAAMQQTCHSASSSSRGQRTMTLRDCTPTPGVMALAGAL